MTHRRVYEVTLQNRQITICLYMWLALQIEKKIHAYNVTTSVQNIGTNDNMNQVYK